MTHTLSITDELRRITWDQCIPLTVTLEITLRCNIRCLHCYNLDRSEPYEAEKRQSELTPDEIFRIIDEAREAGCLYLAFTGGEALVHPHLLDFIRHARKRHLAVTVKTNGTLLDETTAQKLVEAGTVGVEISLYGASAATYDQFARAAGAFEKTLAGARMAKALGMNVKINFCLVQTNRHEIGQMIGIAQELGVPYGLDPQITARYDGTSNSSALSLDRASLEALYRGPLQSMVPRPDFNPHRSVQCACARTVCGISAFGEVYPCIGAPVPSGNLRQKSFKEIWLHSPELNHIRGLKLDDFRVCKPCPHRPYCRRSSGVIYTNTGNYTGPSFVGEEWTCMEAEVLHALHDETNTSPQTTTSTTGQLQRHSFDSL